MTALLLVGAGGFLGAIGRYLMGMVPFEGDFPFMTFLVNFLGSFAIGAIAEVASTTNVLSSETTLFLKTGLCGGFTTFSTFSLETLTLFENGKYATGALYAAGSLVACVLGVAAGKVAVRAVLFFLQLVDVQGA